MIENKIKYLAPFKFLLIISLVLAGCKSGAEDQQVQEIISTQKAETALFEMEVVALLTERAPTVTSTLAPSSTPTETIMPTLTETTVKDPWVLQDICYDEPGRCVKYTFSNSKNDFWVSIKLTHLETGITGDYSIEPFTKVTITLVPGEYEGIYGGWCAGNILTVIRVRELGAEGGILRCHKQTANLSYIKY
ncbi:MAG: hypothetical protein DRI65_16345 [Chloroflexota bacterium]|nr:MAG: hypothetical protein DRI65_16345 [Chloroflexota bacterium]